MLDIRLVSPIVTRGFRSNDAVERFEGEGFVLSHWQADAGPGSIESAADDALAAPAVMQGVIKAAADGCDGAVIDCMQDPGLFAARELVRIPVIGVAQATMLTAAGLGDRFSIVTVMGRQKPIFRELALRYGVLDRLASVRAIEIPVLELERDRQAAMRRTVAEAERAVIEDGADTLIFGCTGMWGYAKAVAAALSELGFSVPVIDPVPLAARMACLLVRSGLVHSTIRYPRPDRKAIDGLEQILPDLKAIYG